MAKRKETLELEQTLEVMAKNKRWYGCEEVTIGFANNGHGDEICDYILMDAKKDIRCYELKVTKADLKSRAKKSWFGHYNYLVLSGELYNEIKDELQEYDIPDDVGIIVGWNWKNCYLNAPRTLETVKKSKKRELDDSEILFVTHSLVRTMMYKLLKYKDANNLEKLREINKKKSYWERSYRHMADENRRLHRIIRNIEHYIKSITNIRIRLEDFSEIINPEDDY